MGLMNKGLEEGSVFGPSRTAYQLEESTDFILRSPDDSDEESKIEHPQRRNSDVQCYKSLYMEEQERSRHFESMKDEYEQLYLRFLQKSIKADKEKYELEVRIRKRLLPVRSKSARICVIACLCVATVAAVIVLAW